MKKTVLLFFISFLALGSGGVDLHLEKANIDLTDKASLQRGAEAFLQNCFSCHSMKYQRYNRVARDIGFSEEKMLSMIYSNAKIGDLMTIAMPEKSAKSWFGAPPPDLTLEARVRSPDWIYTYLKSFYKDSARPFGVNNTVFPAVGMPHVLEHLQGQYVLNDKGHLQQIKAGTLSVEEYNQYILDITNFLTYSSEPIRLERESLGKKVLLYLFILFIIAYFLKKEYWKDVH